VLFSLVNVFGARSDVQRAFHRLFSNPWLWLAVGLSLLLQVAVLYLPVLQSAFGTVPLDARDWALSAAVANSVLWLREAVKVAGRARGAR
jgi:P-type Ca2+ transporter type 2C